jgi:diaminopimelate epimerase
MKIPITKYHALGNDFVVLENQQIRAGPTQLSLLAQAICERREGVGADGIVLLCPDRRSDAKIDIYNADGSWAEKSGNGMRIAAVHLARRRSRRHKFVFRTGSGIDQVSLVRKIPGGYVSTCRLGEPDFLASNVPVRTKLKYVLNSPLKIGPEKLPVTCLSVGNPHTVLIVDDFDFDWKQLGADIETAPIFPNGTNIEFVRIKNRRKLIVAEWERGAGPTGSSGTGAAAAVCALVMLGLADRSSDVQFERGTMSVDWDADTNAVSVTGPAVFVMDGTFDFK